MMWDNFWKWVTDHYLYNAIVTIAVIIIIFNVILKLKPIRKFLNKYKKIKVGSVELELKDGDSDKDIEQDGILDYLKEELRKINERLDRQYKFIKNAVIQSGISVVWSGNTKAPFVEMINAALLNVSLGANGNLKERIIVIIMEEGKNGVSIYRSLLDSFIKNNKERLNDHFYEVIEWIDKRLV